MRTKIKDFNIGKYKISEDNYPFVVAELSGNHKGSIKRALKLVDLAADCGVNAIKLQTFKPDKITLNCRSKDFYISDKLSKWRGKYLYDLFVEAYTPWEWHKEIFQKAKERKLEFFSSPFHDEAVEFLEKLNVPCYKIASFENTHLPLIKLVSQTNKPVIISTGMATKMEISELVNELKNNGNKNFALLKCTSSYPAEVQSFNLETLLDMKKKYYCHVGLSDHSINSSIPAVAVALGARIIERHITLSVNDGAIDSFFSTDKFKFKNFVENVKASYDSIGRTFYGATKEEVPSLKERKSIYAIKNIRQNEMFTKDNIAIIRPSYGLKPKFYNKILGKKSKNKINFGKPIKKIDIK